MEKVCELINISLNKNTVPGDKSALSPSGIRIGTSCMTTRQMDKNGWNKVADWLYECVGICLERQNKYGKKLKDWGKDIEKDEKIISLRKEVTDYARQLYFNDYFEM